MNHALLPSIPNATLPQKYEAAKLALAECNRIDECHDWGDKAQALASYAKQADDKEMEKTAMRIRARAITRCGQLLKEIEKSLGGRPSKTKDGGEPSLTRKDAATKAGLSERQAKQAIRVANVPKDDFEEQVESDNPPTVTALAEQGKKRRKMTPMEEKMAQGIPVYEQLGMTKKAFQAGMYFSADIALMAAKTQEYDVNDVVAGSQEKDRKEMIQNIKTIVDKLDALNAALGTQHNLELAKLAIRRLSVLQEKAFHQWLRDTRPSLFTAPPQKNHRRGITKEEREIEARINKQLAAPRRRNQ